MVFSFYYTSKIATLVLNKNPLMITINEEAKNYNIESVNATIEGDYITPGINGLYVNAKDSYYKMQEADVFNKYYLVFDELSPKISLKDHKDKIIKNGNNKFKNVSIILEYDSEIMKYFETQKIEASLISNLNTYKKNSYFEVLNGETTNFKAFENTLNLNKENTNICLVNIHNKDMCLKNKKYLVEPTLILNNTNFLEVKKNLDRGSIIYIKKGTSLSDIKLLIKEITYKDLATIPLSKLIAEDNRRY